MIFKLHTHISRVVRKKFEKTAALSKQKDNSPEKGRVYVRAYVDYVHTIEGIHSWIDGTAHATPCTDNTESSVCD